MRTSIKPLEGVVGEERDAGVGQDPYHRRYVALVEGEYSFRRVDLTEHVSEGGVFRFLSYSHPGPGQVQGVGEGLGRGSRQGAS